MVSATANMLTVIAQTGAIVDSVSISGRCAIVTVTVIMGANEKATESHLLWSAILVASGCIILGKDGELAFASANYSLILALYIYIYNDIYIYIIIYIYKCPWFLVSVMSFHVPSFSVLRSVDLNLIKADGSLGSSVLDPVLSQAACRLRQLTTDECWSTLLPVEVWYRWMLWFADAVYRARWFAFSTFCRVQTSIDIAGSLFLPWKPVCKATQMLNFLLWLELHITVHVLYVYHQLHTISYIDSRKQSPHMILFVGHFLTWKLDEIGPRFTAIDAIMPGVAKIRATVWRLEKIQPLNPLNSTGVVTVVHSCRLQRFCDTGAFATICPLNQLFPTTIIQFCVLCSGSIRCIKSSGNIRNAQCLRCLPRMQRLDGWRESTSWVEWPFAQLNRAVFRRYSFEWLLRIKKK